MRAQRIIFPCQTANYIAVWLPDAKVLIPDENRYHAFPTLYAVCGTSRHEFGAWPGSLYYSNVRVLASDYKMPIFSAVKVRDVLATSRAVILQVMRHTADGTDVGKYMEDIAASITLPRDIVGKSWLGEI